MSVVISFFEKFISKNFRIARQEVKIDDLKRELISAVIHLEQAGVDWRPMYEEDVDQKHDADQVRESQENEEPDEKFASPREGRY